MRTDVYLMNIGCINERRSRSCCADVEVPGFVESVLQSAHAAEHGFDLRDAALMASRPIQNRAVSSRFRAVLELFRAVFELFRRAFESGRDPRTVDLRLGIHPAREGPRDDSFSSVCGCLGLSAGILRAKRARVKQIEADLKRI